MLLDGFQWFLLIAGLVFGSVGALTVFSNSFLHVLDRTIWKETKWDRMLFSSETGYWFNRYGRGLGSLLLGAAMLYFFFSSLNR
jgi:hypothetical protein